MSERRLGLRRVALACAVLVILALSLWVLSARSPTPTPTSSPERSPARVTEPAFAPYVEMSGPDANTLTAATDAGLEKVTAAFVVGQGCTGVWDDRTPLTDAARASALSTAQRKGVQVVLSFGGQGGKDLARTCADVTRLTAAYQSTITRFHVTRVDFDIEGAAIDPTAQRAQIARRFAAIRSLASASPGLDVSLTIPAGPSGLEPSGLALLKTAKSTRTRVDSVNIMAMDYGSRVTDMGAAAISGARGALDQLKTVWPTFTYAQLGITPMIGQNDTVGEALTLAQAEHVVSWARANRVGWLAFWSLNRDQPCPGPTTVAQDGCSGAMQSAQQFTRVFLGLS